MLKKILFSLLLIPAVLQSLAQDVDKTIAMQLLLKNVSTTGFSRQDITNSIISSAYYNKMSGTQLIYLQQSFRGLPIWNKVQTLAFKNGQLVSKAGERMNSMEKISGGQTAEPVITPTAAVDAAFFTKKIANNQLITGRQITGSKKIDFGQPVVTKEKITAELMWIPLNEGKKLRLAWQINLSPAATADNWLINIDAENSEVISEINLTVYCNFNHPDKHNSTTICSVDKNIKKETFAEPDHVTIINNADYRVVPYPAESPNHQGGSPALRNNPWTLAAGNATSLKWHSDGTNDYIYTRGNNVWAYHDRTNNNTADPAKSATSTTGADPLTFDFIPDFTVNPTQNTPVQNQQFNITNLFYWNNIIHDLTYQYGFDEPAGNFQASNQGRGGAGNDYVRAEAQDGGGTNNANFNTPADGGSGRMQMYLWNGNPQKDGDVDNGIVVHEFSHGISNRLTGGPAQAGCLGNEEQMGEGWSDYFALMATHNWATATLADGFNNPRGIGTYATGASPTGNGIRPRRYTTNMGINEMTYANVPGQVIPHGVGFVWCTMLWDMTWEIIQQAGINPNLFNAGAAGGNTIALKLVTEGMKLQPCSPGFIDGRNAILQADQLLYGGQYRCAIVAAFARRGLGFDASQGSSSSRSDGIAGFSTVESLLTLSQNVMQQTEGQNVTYSSKVTAGICSGLSNYLLTDTLPSNVTYISGGTYTAATRVVSFPVNLAAGQTQNYSFTIQINAGSWFPTTNLLDEKVLTTSISPNWNISSINATNFAVSQVQSRSTPNSFFGVNAATASDYSIATTTPVAINANPAFLSFWHNYNTEDGWDGGMVEMSTNAGTSWTDLGPYMTVNGYNGSMGSGSNNPLGGRAAFTGNSNGFKKTTVSLAAFANQNVLLRFRVGADDNTSIAGWYVDDILIQSQAVINIQSNLFTASGNRVNVSDTSTIILQDNGCTVASISTQPLNANGCVGSNVSFSVSAAGTAVGYQWEISTNAGVSYTPVPGAVTNTFNINNITVSMNNNRYRVIVSNACPSLIISTGAVLSVTNAAVISSNPVNATVCLNGNTSFSATASGSNLTYQWEISTNGGLNFTVIPGAVNNILMLSNITAGINNNQYRVAISSCGPSATYSTAAMLSITSPANFITNPASITVCPNDNAGFSATVNGSNLTYQWQMSSNGGVTFTPVPGAINATLNLSSVNFALNGNQYRVVVNGTCTVDLTSVPATLSVNIPLAINNPPVNKEACAGATVVYNVAATGSSLSYQWQISVNSGGFVSLSNGVPYSGVTTNTLTISGVSTAMNGAAYRVIVSGPPCGAVNSTSASLTVYALPAVVLTAAEYSRIIPGLPSALYTTISPAGLYTYQWFKNNVMLAGVTGNSYPVDVDRFGNYTVKVTDRNGCSATSNLITISDSASNQLFVYPNPGNGTFQVRYYNADISSTTRTLIIYDARGSRIYTKQYNQQGNAYFKMEVILKNASAGIYMIDLRDDKGKRLASGSVIIQ